MLFVNVAMPSECEKQSRLCRMSQQQQQVSFKLHDAQELHSRLQADKAPAELQRFFLAFEESEWPSRLRASDVLYLLNQGGQLAARARSEICGVCMTESPLNTAEKYINEQPSTQVRMFPYSSLSPDVE
eukprot:IDg21376t1